MAVKIELAGRRRRWSNFLRPAADILPPPDLYVRASCPHLELSPEPIHPALGQEQGGQDKIAPRSKPVVGKGLVNQLLCAVTITRRCRHAPVRVPRSADRGPDGDLESEVAGDTCPD